MNPKIEEAVRSVQQAFPFEEYITGALEPYYTVGETVSKYLQEGQSLYDFGSGPCDKTAVAQELGIQCTAYDDLQDHWHLQDGNADKIRAFTREVGIDLVEKYDPPKKPTYDMVMLNDVLEHLHDSPREILNDLVESLNEGGYLFASVPNLANIRKRLSLLRGQTNLPSYDLLYWYPGTWRGPVREYVRSDLQKLSKFLGLEVVEISTRDHFLANLKPALKAPYRLITRVFGDWRDTWVLVARKPKGWTPRRTNDQDLAANVIGRSQGVNSSK